MLDGKLATNIDAAMEERPLTKLGEYSKKGHVLSTEEATGTDL